MRAVVAIVVLAAVVTIAAWMVRLGRRDYREMRSSSDRTKPFEALWRAQLAGVLVIVPLFPFLWLDPPVLTWVATIYLVAVSAVLGWVLYRRGNE